ncbi:MAG: hypothetical protein ABEJ65_04580, partial [bacterium]
MSSLAGLENSLEIVNQLIEVDNPRLFIERLQSDFRHYYGIEIEVNRLPDEPAGDTVFECTVGTWNVSVPPDQDLTDPGPEVLEQWFEFLESRLLELTSDDSSWTIDQPLEFINELVEGLNRDLPSDILVERLLSAFERNFKLSVQEIWIDDGGEYIPVVNKRDQELIQLEDAIGGTLWEIDSESNETSPVRIQFNSSEVELPRSLSNVLPLLRYYLSQIHRTHKKTRHELIEFKGRFGP